MPILTIYKDGAKKWDEWANRWVYYENFMKMFLMSLNRHNPEEMVYIKTLGVSESAKKDFLKLNGNVIFEEGENKDVEGTALWAYFRSVEFDWWKSKLEAHPDQTFIHTDNDLLFRDSIKELYDLMIAYDVGFPFDQTAQDRSKYNKGIFAIKGSEGLRFIKEWEVASDKKYKEDRPDGWYTTQLSVFSVLSHGNYKLLKFPSKYHDSHLTPGGVIWHAHHLSKYDKLLRFRSDLSVNISLL